MRPVWGRQAACPRVPDPSAAARAGLNCGILGKTSLTPPAERLRQNPTTGSRFTAFSPAPRHGSSGWQTENVGEDVVTQANIVTMTGHEQKSMTIDGAHLERMTLGDRSLEGEVLEIFARQTTLTLQRIRGAAAEQAAAAAHTLKGSARDWSLARGAGGRVAGAGGW